MSLNDVSSKRALGDDDDDGDEGAKKPHVDVTIDTKLSEISLETAAIEIAFQPALPPQSAAFAHMQQRDVVVLLDLTFSMKGPGIAGLKTVMANFDNLITHTLGNATLTPDERAVARQCTNISFLGFGNATKAFEDVEHFVSATSENLSRCTDLITSQLECYMASTNIEQAVKFASDLLKTRFEAKRFDDVQRGVSRSGSIVLITDGAPNSGCVDGEAIIDAHVGKKYVHVPGGADTPVHASLLPPISTFAIAIGADTAPDFLSKLVEQTGFWHFVSTPTDPMIAFERTIGVIVTAAAPYIIALDAVVVRPCGVEQEKSTTLFNFGMLGTNTLEPTIVKIPVPANAAIGDTIRCTVKIGSFFEKEIVIDVSGVEVASTRLLFDETKQVKESLALLKQQLLENPATAYESTRSRFASNHTALRRVDATIDLLASARGFGSRERFLDDLSQCPTMDYQRSQSSTTDGGRRPSSMRHSVQSSFSQLSQ